jgi:predicted hydrocarbon binding protein
MYTRKELGDFSSVICLKALIIGVEDTLGDGAAAVFIRGGKVRGEALAKSLGWAGKRPPVEELAAALDSALGKSGTRLCQVKKAYQEGNSIIVETSDTVCSAGEEEGSPRRCTFTLGAVWGAIETAMGTKYNGSQTDSVLAGGSSDKFVFTPV